MSIANLSRSAGLVLVLSMGFGSDTFSQYATNQVQAAKPTMDYDYAVSGGKQKPFWTPQMFVEAVYRDVSNDVKAAKSGSSAR